MRLWKQPLCLVWQITLPGVNPHMAQGGHALPGGIQALVAAPVDDLLGKAHDDLKFRRQTVRRDQIRREARMPLQYDQGTGFALGDEDQGRERCAILQVPARSTKYRLLRPKTLIPASARLAPSSARRDPPESSTQ